MYAHRQIWEGKGLATKDVTIATMRLDKRKVYLPDNPNELYSNMVVALINRLCSDGIINKLDSIQFVASRRNTSKKLNDDFTESIKHCTNDLSFETRIIAPSNDKCLQAVDFASWALWQKYEFGNETYSDMIAEKIAREYIMYE